MSDYYGSEMMGEDNDDIISVAFDEYSGAKVTLISCPPEAIGGDGPMFSHMDKKNIYILISDRFYDNLAESAPNPVSGAMQQGMVMGDVMRRGIYYAQNLNKKRRNKNDESR